MFIGIHLLCLFDCDAKLLIGSEIGMLFFYFQDEHVYMYHNYVYIIRRCTFHPFKPFRNQSRNLHVIM